MENLTDKVSVPLDRVEAMVSNHGAELQESLASNGALNQSQIALSRLVDANAHGQMIDSLRDGGVESLELPADVAEGGADAEWSYTAAMVAGDTEMQRSGIDRPEIPQGPSNSVEAPDLEFGGNTVDDETLLAGAGGLRGRTVDDVTAVPPNGWSGSGDYDIHLMSNVAGGVWGAIGGGQQHGFVVVTDAGAEPTPENAYLVMRGGPYPYDTPGFDDVSREGQLYVDDTDTSRFDLAANNITSHGSIEITDSLQNIEDRMNTVRNDINPENGEQGYPYSGGSLLSPFNVGANSNTVARLVFQEATQYDGDPDQTIDPIKRMTGWNINLNLPNAQHDYDYEGRYSATEADQTVAAGRSSTETVEHHHGAEDYDYDIL